MTTDREKEHLLHKLVAASAFVCALCILPVAQYVLVGGQQAEGGTVAGVSTDSSIVSAAVTAPSPALTCAQQQVQLKALASWLSGKTESINHEFETDPVVAQYRAALAGPGISAEDKSALSQLIDIAHKPYLDRLSAAESAVDSQKKELESVSCLPE